MRRLASVKLLMLRLLIVHPPAEARVLLPLLGDVAISVDLPVPLQFEEAVHPARRRAYVTLHSDLLEETRALLGDATRLALPAQLEESALHAEPGVQPGVGPVGDPRRPPVLPAVPDELVVPVAPEPGPALPRPLEPHRIEQVHPLRGHAAGLPPRQEAVLLALRPRPRSELVEGGVVGRVEVAVSGLELLQLLLTFI